VTDLEFHSLANIFPLIDGPEFNVLAADILANGVIEPVVLFEGQILDGRNRYRASKSVGVDCPLKEYHGTDPAGYVVSLNIHRRHLTESQRAMAAAKLANMPAHRPSKSANLRGNSQSEAAKLLNVSERTVNAAKKVQQQGAPELTVAVEVGRVAVSAASDVATLPKANQVEIVARGERAILEAAKSIRAKKAVARRAERLDRLAEISRGNANLGTEQKYPALCIKRTKGL